MSELPISDARHSTGEDVVAHVVPREHIRVQGEPPVPMDGLPADGGDDVEAHLRQV